MEGNQRGACRLDPKKSRRERTSEFFLHSENLRWGEPLCRQSMIVALSPGDSDITRFRPWSPMATGNNLDLAEKIPKVAQTTGTVDDFDARSGISGPTSRIASACPNLRE